MYLCIFNFLYFVLVVMQKFNKFQQFDEVSFDKVIQFVESIEWVKEISVELVKENIKENGDVVVDFRLVFVGEFYEEE